MSPERFPPVAGAIGVQLDAAAQATTDGWHESLRAIGDLPWLFLPTTADEAAIAAAVLRGLPRGRALPPAPAGELRAVVAGLRLLICSSADLARVARAEGVAVVAAGASPGRITAEARAALALPEDAGGDAIATRIAANLHPMVERLGRDLAKLHHIAAEQDRRITELAGEVDRQSTEIARRERLLREIVESRAWRLVTAVREALAAIRRPRSRASDSEPS